jgi:arylsulfatase A-like enzyme
MFILYDRREKGNGAQVSGAQLMDVTPTLLELFGIQVPPEVQGRSLFRRPRQSAAPLSASEAAQLAVEPSSVPSPR